MKLGQPLVFFFPKGNEYLNNSGVIAHAICTRPWPTSTDGYGHQNIAVISDQSQSIVPKSSVHQATSFFDALYGESATYGSVATVEDCEDWGIDLSNGNGFTRVELEALYAKTAPSAG